MPIASIGPRSTANLSSSTDSFVQSFQHLQGRPHAEKATTMLQRVASLVKPIMRAHGWVLPLLAEFFPAEPNLVGLNVNHGQKILLRLRPAHAPDSFYDEDQLVGVMLHELTHNVYGPHDSKFYAYLAKLESEYDDIQRSGYAGEGFFSPGERLGTGKSHNLPPRQARGAALEAAERRRKNNLMSGTLGGSRLGGDWRKPLHKTPQQLALEAAERRMKDEKACAHDSVDAQREAEKASRDSEAVAQATDLPPAPSEPVVIEIDSDTDEEASHAPSAPIVKAEPGNDSDDGFEVLPPKPKNPPTKNVNAGASNRPAVSSSSRPVTSGPSARTTLPTPKPKPAAAPTSNSEWTCLTCTLINNPQADSCDACLTPRPRSQLDGWSCLNCGEAGNDNQFWTCKFCGTMKFQS